MDFVAAILELTAAFMVGNKNKYGFVLFFITGLVWITYVIVHQHTFGLLLVVVPALGINVRNFLKWRREE
jgi:hypothetical protein